MPAQLRQLAAVLPAFIGGALSDCSRGYTCCAVYDFPALPVREACVEDDPSGHKNCKRDGRAPVPWWVRFQDPERYKDGVCAATTPNVTLADLAKKEAAGHEFAANYTRLCTENAANCSAAETCYYEGTHMDGASSVWSGNVRQDGVACVCQFNGMEYARADADGGGSCVVCKAGPAGASVFVQNAQGTAAKTFRNGELACAFGPADEGEVVMMQV
mmetsp:Transcript_118468/g.335884  ORF Transcript_118468/g.335884 Transcript_118468/m.335884 type:complete len:216 (-) Transcript_118468:101-748(-)